MKPIRLIATDMDGTLLNSRQQLSPLTAQTLRDAARQGVKLAICSGRAPGDNVLFARENGLEDCAILSLNGAYCMERLTEPPYAVHYMDEETARTAVRWFREENITFAAFAENTIAVFPGGSYDEETFWGSYRDVPGAPEYPEGEAALLTLERGRLNKLVCMEFDLDKLARMKERLAALPSLVVTSSWEGNLELMHADINKGHAVRELAERLGLEKDQVMTLGDYDNDLTMIRYAGLGIAMGNAVQAVKDAANYVTLTNDQDGVAAAIRQFVLD